MSLLHQNPIDNCNGGASTPRFGLKDVTSIEELVLYANYGWCLHYLTRLVGLFVAGDPCLNKKAPCDDHLHVVIVVVTHQFTMLSHQQWGVIEGVHEGALLPVSFVSSLEFFWNWSHAPIWLPGAFLLCDEMCFHVVVFLLTFWYPGWYHHKILSFC